MAGKTEDIEYSCLGCDYCFPEATAVPKEERGGHVGIDPLYEVDFGAISKDKFEDLKHRLLDLAKEERNRQKQGIISEDELEDYLKKGWRYVDENSQGVVVER